MNTTLARVIIPLALAGLSACDTTLAGGGGGSLQPDAGDPGPGGPDAGTPFTCGSASFTFTETQEVFTVPVNVTYVHAKVWGAGGNQEAQCGATEDAGMGGYSEAVLQAYAGSPLVIIVGQRGRAGLTGEERARTGFGDWGGGGLSGVFQGPELVNATDTAKALIIAGGGGSAGAPGCNPGGHGNATTAGGMPSMQGGVGADEINGGAGGFAGGSGGARGTGSKGGTSYVAPEALDKVSVVATTAGIPPKTDDPDYDGIAGKAESSGRVVLHFACAPDAIE